jgi:hypothetical protein
MSEFFDEPASYGAGSFSDPALPQVGDNRSAAPPRLGPPLPGPRPAPATVEWQVRRVDTIVAPPPTPPRRGTNWGWVTLGCVLVALGIAYLDWTRYGSMRLDLSDPRANVQVRVDGELVSLDRDDPRMRLRPGPHRVDVSGPGLEPVTEYLNVDRGIASLVHIPVRPERGPQRDLIHPEAWEGRSPYPVQQARVPLPLPSGELRDETRQRVERLLAWVAEAQRAGKFAEAEAHSREVLRVVPGNVEARLGRARARLGLNQPADALAIADQILADHPDNRQARAVRTACLERMSDNPGTAAVDAKPAPEPPIGVAVSLR